MTSNETLQVSGRQLMAGWVGLDVGTTSSKVVVYDDAGEPLASGRHGTVWDITAYGVQITPARLSEGAKLALTEALDQVPERVVIAGIGITSMGETGVLVDGQGRPVAPAIAWHDTRDAAQVERLRNDIGEVEFAARTGKPLRGQFSLTKHRWLSDQHMLAGAVRRFNVAEWVARGLGGDEAADRSLACRTGWFDLSADRWWDEGLAWSGASAELMPPLVQSGQPVGRVSTGSSHPRLTGAVITLAGHDHQAAALGAGAGGLGDELDSSGTAEALVRTIAPELSTDQVVALARQGITTDVSIQPGLWSLLAGTEGGLAMQRALAALGVTRDDLPALDEQARRATPGGVQVTGIGGPALGLSNITDGVGPGHLWRAVVEGATDQALRLHRAMADIVGAHQRFVVTGGWSNSAMVMQSKLDAFGPVTRSPVTEAGTLGAAILAARAAGQLGQHDTLGRTP